MIGAPINSGAAHNKQNNDALRIADNVSAYVQELCVIGGAPIV